MTQTKEKLLIVRQKRLQSSNPKKNPRARRVRGNVYDTLPKWLRLGRRIFVPTSRYSPLLSQ